MDYMARLKELDGKLEREGLTENEQAEVALIHSMSLLALSKENKQILAELRANLRK